MSRPLVEMEAVALESGEVVLACSCCEQYVMRGSEALCRDWYEHGHPTARFDGYAFFGSSYVRVVDAWRCAGCGCMMVGGSVAWPGVVLRVGV